VNNRVVVVIILLIVAFLAGFVPQYMKVSRLEVTRSNSPQTLTINGAGFVNKPSVFVTWSTGSMTISASGVTFLSSTQLQMSITTQTNPDIWP
jgi:hypothetical protein